MFSLFGLGLINYFYTRQLPNKLKEQLNPILFVARMLLYNAQPRPRVVVCVCEFVMCVLWVKHFMRCCQALPTHSQRGVCAICVYTHCSHCVDARVCACVLVCEGHVFMDILECNDLIKRWLERWWDGCQHSFEIMRNTLLNVKRERVMRTVDGNVSQLLSVHSSDSLTALRLIGLVTAVVAAIAEPTAGYALVNGLAFELIVGTGIHYISVVHMS